jgi:hypothetical protein
MGRRAELKVGQSESHCSIVSTSLTGDGGWGCGRGAERGRATFYWKVTRRLMRAAEKLGSWSGKTAVKETD